MNTAQHQFFNLLVQKACESRVQLHEVAWIVIGLLLVSGLFVFGLIWVWIISGGFSRQCCLDSVRAREVLKCWLNEQ